MNPVKNALRNNKKAMELSVIRICNSGIENWEWFNLAILEIIKVIR